MKKLATAMTVTMLAALPTHAQEKTHDAVAESDILVTGRGFVAGRAAAASKSDLAIVETPQAVSIVDADLIDALNVRTVSEALNYTSGVRSQSFGSDTRIDYYQIRGFAQSNFLKDGLALYNSGPFLSWTTPAEGIGRLEILKGPSSTLYGGGSAGGLVNIVSKAPVRSPYARAEAGVDEYGSGYLSVDLGGAVGKTVAARLVGLVRRGDTQVELAEDNRTYAAGSLTWTPTPETTLTLRASYTGDRSNRPTGFVPYAGFVTPLADGRRIPIDLFVSDPSVDRYDRDQYEAGYTLETRITSNSRFVSNSRFGRITLIYSGLYGSFGGNPVVSGGRYLLNRANSYQTAWLDNFTTDNHLDVHLRTGRFEHDLLGGVDYSFSETASTTSMGAAPSLDIFAPSYNVAIPALGPPATTRQKLDQFGLYFQDTIRWSGLVALLSTRQDWVGVTAMGGPGGVTRGTPRRQTHRAGLSRPMRIGLAPYVAFATSFSPVIGVEAATGRFFRPETGRSWEIGLKYKAPSLPLFASASLFTIDRDGVLVSNPVAGFPTNQSQMGKVRSRGGEFEIQARPTPSLNVVAALTAFDIDNRAGTAAALGRSPTATPEFTASAFADYTFPEAGALPGVGIGAGVRRVGHSYADAANSLVVPGATVFDAAVHYDFDRFRAALNASNVFDRTYVGACPSAGTCYAANLRRATFSISYRLGENQ